MEQSYIQPYLLIVTDPVHEPHKTIYPFTDVNSTMHYIGGNAVEPEAKCWATLHGMVKPEGVTAICIADPAWIPVEHKMSDQQRYATLGIIGLIIAAVVVVKLIRKLWYKKA